MTIIIIVVIVVVVTAAAVFIVEIAVLSVFFPLALCSFVFVVAATDINQGVELEPEFVGSISNVTYPVGREAVLTCSVK